MESVLNYIDDKIELISSTVMFNVLSIYTPFLMFNIFFIVFKSSFVRTVTSI